MWTEDRVTHKGRHYSFKDVRVLPKPIQKPHPPIWVAAKSEATVKHAAKIGDVWYADPVTPMAVLKDRTRVYKGTLNKHGRDFYRLERPLFREICLDKDRDAAWDIAREPIFSVYREYFQDSHFLDEDGRILDPSKVSFDQWEEKARKRFILGNADDCISEVEKYYKELEITEILFRFSFPGIPHKKIIDEIKIIAEKVRPYFQGRT